MTVRTPSPSSTSNSSAAVAEAARQRAAAAAARASAEAATKKAATGARKELDGYKGPARRTVALDGKPTAANVADIQKAKADAPTVSAKLPKNPDELPRMFPELKGADKETVKKAYDALNKLASGDASEKLKALADLFEQFPTTLGNVLDKMGVKDNTLVKLATNKGALSALSTLTDGKKGVVDKARATLQLASAVGDSIAPRDLEGVLKTALKGLPAAEKLVGAVSAWADPGKTGLEKARATLELASALKEFAGSASPKLANDLRALGGPLKAAGAALTLLDPKASATDKVAAGAQLAAELPELKKNVTAFKELLTKAGVKDAGEIAEGAGQAATEVAVKGLDPALARGLSQAETKQLEALARKVGADKLEPVLKGLTDKAALEALQAQLGGLDAAAGKRLLSMLGGLEHGVLEKTLKNPQLAASLGMLAGKLDDEGARVASKMVKDFDEAALKSLVRFTDHLAPDALKDGLKLLGPAMEKGGSKVVGQGLRVLEHVLGRMGVTITREVAARALKNLVKVIPVVGAVPNAIDAVKYGREATELRGKNKDLGMLALNAAKLNVLDGAAGIIMDATGIGVVADIAVSVGFSAAELALDIGFEQEKARMLADPKGYKAPDWVKAVNLGAAALLGPQGMVELAAYYGPEGATQLVEWGVEKGVKGAVDVAKLAGTALAEGVGDDLKMTGQMLHGLADVVRNPQKYGKAVADAAVKTYNEVIEKGGALAEAARKQLGEVVDEARKLGAKGLETLKWLAQNPGPAAKLAVDGIKRALSSAIEAGTEAGKALAKKGLETLESLHDGWENLKGAAKEQAKELIQSAKDGIKAGLNKAFALGEKGLDLVVWAANHPGEVWAGARKAVTDVLQKGGALAEKTWTEIVALKDKGVGLAKDAIAALKNGGEKAVETLKYVIQNPGEAASKVRAWAGQTLKDMVTAGGGAAKKAAGAIKEFIDNRLEFAQALGRDLLRQGSEAFLEVAKGWKDELTEGGKALLDGLKDLGSAGAEQLQKLARLGGQLAGAAVARLKSLASSGVEAAKTALGALAGFGGEVGRLASEGYDAVKDATSGDFTVGGHQFDVNPFW